jgi:hypothetical protein
MYKGFQLKRLILSDAPSIRLITLGFAVTLREIIRLLLANSLCKRKGADHNKHILQSKKREKKYKTKEN